jgi:hypothetical protein
MSFEEYPIVDDNSKASEESVLFVKKFFSRKNGFISREEDSDYGCDLDVELISEEIGASSKKFPIQIKSSSNITIIKVNEQEFVSLPFKTSRIGYLCRRSPGYGLIILYDALNEICYYDYTEEMVKRLLNERKDDGWKKLNEVNIHIPKTNLLNEVSIESIQESFENRHKSHDLLNNKYGKEFDIPVLSPQSGNIVDESEKMSTFQMLREYGLLLVNSYEFGLLYNLITKLSFQEINDSKELIFLACITFCEVGELIEADFYLNKAQRNIEYYDEEQLEILKFIQIKIDHLLGRRSFKNFADDLQALKHVIKNPLNKVQIEINLLYYKLFEKGIDYGSTKEIESKIFEIFNNINSAPLEENKKYLLRLYQAENLNMYANNFLLKSVYSIRIKESLNKEVPQKEWDSYVEKNNLFIHYSTSVCS